MPNFRSDLSDDHILKPVWAFRIFPALAALCVGLAMLVSKNPLHDVFLGLAFGLLVALSVASVQLKAVTCKVAEETSDVQDLRIT
ncbi:MAG TPA: hypothetical protein VNW54_05965 [Granulicella sp.]|jgi:hypothetical protein|nr:hypothetical protein [Granulicella sp.]